MSHLSSSNLYFESTTSLGLNMTTVPKSKEKWSKVSDSDLAGLAKGELWTIRTSTMNSDSVGPAAKDRCIEGINVSCAAENDASGNVWVQSK